MRLAAGVLGGSDTISRGDQLRLAGRALRIGVGASYASGGSPHEACRAGRGEIGSPHERSGQREVAASHHDDSPAWGPWDARAILRSRVLSRGTGRNLHPIGRTARWDGRSSHAMWRPIGSSGLACVNVRPNTTAALAHRPGGRGALPAEEELAGRGRAVLDARVGTRVRRAATAVTQLHGPLPLGGATSRARRRAPSHRPAAPPSHRDHDGAIWDASTGRSSARGSTT
jgi:hypothetical protein